MTESERFKALFLGNIQITNFPYQGLRVMCHQSVPTRYGESTYYQNITHNFPIDTLSALPVDLEIRAQAFIDAISKNDDVKTHVMS